MNTGIKCENHAIEVLMKQTTEPCIDMDVLGQSILKLMDVHGQEF